MRGFLALERVLLISVVSALLTVSAYYVFADPMARHVVLSGMATAFTALWGDAIRGDVLAIAVMGALAGVVFYVLHSFRDFVYTALLLVLLIGGIQGALFISKGSMPAPAPTDDTVHE